MVREPLCSKMMIEPLVLTKKILVVFIYFFVKYLQAKNIFLVLACRNIIFKKGHLFFLIVMYRFGNGAPICIVCIGWESQCLLYARFFTECFSRGLRGRLGGEGGCFSMLSKYVVMWPFLIIEICRHATGEEPAWM